MIIAALIIAVIALAVGVLALVAEGKDYKRSIRYMECVKEHYENRINELSDSLEHLAGMIDTDDGTEIIETRRKALEAERRFTEGVTNILNFSYGPSGKKGE